MLERYINYSRKIELPAWQRLLLLAILTYEGLGGLFGGILLVIEPDGHLMDLPRNLMHGFFPDFLIPGVILTCMGALNIVALLALIGKQKFAWVLANMAMFGFAIWFIVEISIIRELHWLHIMWGVPVLIGDYFAFKLIPWNVEHKT